MEVIFTQDVANQARAGEVRRVADGYARNYLIPQGLAEDVFQQADSHYFDSISDTFIAIKRTLF